ncbi:hypothetical protein [uncultured Brachyspira sp.]|uniref:hypothetical protein n=1 Tax=uncultured Brachyspira sp. TaxID=221953 RepID=UPI00260953F7|nr:hypothetical protein [uncultured Brachyspira sp.]
MIKLEIKETVSYQIGIYTTVTDTLIFESEKDLKKYLLEYESFKGDYLNEDDINELLQTGYSKNEYLKITLRILERS